MTPIAADARRIIESALLRLAAPGCSCEGGEVCQACAAVEALEQLGQAEFVAGMLEQAKRERGDRCEP